MKHPINNLSAVATREQAERALEALIPRIIKCVQDAWEVRAEMQRSLPAKKYAALRDGSIATVVCDWIGDALEDEFKPDAPDIVVHKKYQSTRLAIGNQYITKFNKANRFGNISRNNTYRQGQFENQQPEQPVLTNFEYPTNLIIKYHLNAAATEIQKLTICCPMSRYKNFWEIPILMPTMEEAPAQLSMTLEQTGRTSRVTSNKKQRRQEDHQEHAQEQETN